MQLLVVILPTENELDDILTGFIDIGVAGATIINGAGMIETITRDIPIFAGFRHLIGENEQQRKVILSCIDNDKTMTNAQKLIKNFWDNSEEQESKGIMFTLPIIEFIKP